MYKCTYDDTYDICDAMQPPHTHIDNKKKSLNQSKKLKSKFWPQVKYALHTVCVCEECWCEKWILTC